LLLIVLMQRPMSGWNFGVHALFVFVARRIGQLNKCFVAFAGGSLLKFLLPKPMMKFKFHHGLYAFIVRM